MPYMSYNVIALVSLCILLSFSLVGCSQEKQPFERGASPVNEKVAEKVVPSPEAKDSITLSPKAINRFGISVITVEAKPHVSPLVTTGEIKADENRVFHISSLSNGRVVQDNAKLGDLIRPGQVLAVVQNIDVSKIYGDYIHSAHQNHVDVELAQTRLDLATKNYDRIKKLKEENIAPEKELIKAEADKELEEANLRGLKEHAVHIRAEAKALLSAYGVKLGPENAEIIESNSPIVTPRGGVIIKKNITVGDMVTNVEPLYVVADLGEIWLDITVYDKQLPYVKIGNPVIFTADSLPGRTIKGRITYIKPSTEGVSGTFVARASIENREMLLKPGMLGQVTIENADQEVMPFVPDEAVQKYGNETFVFVESGSSSFKKKMVDLGNRTENGYFIAHGLKAGDRIVGAGSFTLKAEMLKSTVAGED